MIKALQDLSLSQQLALTAAACSLLVALALVVLGSVSSRHMQQAQQQEFGAALASQVAKRVGSSLETGDLLSVAASLQRFVDTSAAEQVELFDVEGKALGRAGEARGQTISSYREEVQIEGDVAGEVVVTVSSDKAEAEQWRLVLSLSGLALLLSGVVFGITRAAALRLAGRLRLMAERISLEDSDVVSRAGNELALLQHNIEQLPMDLLRTRGSGDPKDEDYRKTAVLYLHLTSLADYVDTLDEESLQSYTRRLHRVVYAAAGFYAGELHVARQFGLTLFFNGDASTGSAAFRAASCAWLIKSVYRELEQQLPLSISVSMAVASSELGVGDGSDIYPGLYMQSTIDELQALCAARPPKVLLSPAVCEDVDIEGRVLQHATEMRDYGMLDSFAGPYADLLERQRRLIMKRLSVTGRTRAPAHPAPAQQH